MVGVVVGVVVVVGVGMKKEEFEPFDWDFNKDGLYVCTTKVVNRPKYCIDLALKKILGKDWDKPTGATRLSFRKK